MLLYIRYLFIGFIGTVTSLHVSGQELRIDHVISVYSNLEEPMDDLSKKGFTVKKGTLHANGLLNAHIKFQNLSSFELMSIASEPKDEISRRYEWLLQNEIQGVYLALSGLDQKRIESVLKELAIGFNILKNKSWTYITFADHSDFAHIFFIIYHTELSSSSEYTTHPNGFDVIKNVTIEGSEKVVRLFEELQLSNTSIHPSISTFKTKTGNITVIPQKNFNNRPSLKEITFGRENQSNDITIIFN